MSPSSNMVAEAERSDFGASIAGAEKAATVSRRAIATTATDGMVVVSVGRVVRDGVSRALTRRQARRMRLLIISHTKIYLI